MPNRAPMGHLTKYQTPHRHERRQDPAMHRCPVSDQLFSTLASRDSVMTRYRSLGGVLRLWSHQAGCSEEAVVDLPDRLLLAGVVVHHVPTAGDRGSFGFLVADPVVGVGAEP